MADYLAGSLVGAVVVAVAAWVVAGRLRAGEPVDVVTRALWAATAGALWPVVLIGIAQLMIISVVIRRLRVVRARHIDPAWAAEVELLPARS